MRGRRRHSILCLRFNSGSALCWPHQLPPTQQQQQATRSKCVCVFNGSQVQHKQIMNAARPHFFPVRQAPRASRPDRINKLIIPKCRHLDSAPLKFGALSALRPCTVACHVESSPAANQPLSEAKLTSSKASLALTAMIACALLSVCCENCNRTNSDRFKAIIVLLFVNEQGRCVCLFVCYARETMA